MKQVQKKKCRNCFHYLGNDRCGIADFKNELHFKKYNCLILNPSGNCEYYSNNIIGRIIKKLWK